MKIKTTKVKTYFMWHWKCNRCGKEHSYSDKRCDCRRDE